MPYLGMQVKILNLQVWTILGTFKILRKENLIYLQPVNTSKCVDSPCRQQFLFDKYPQLLPVGYPNSYKSPICVDELLNGQGQKESIWQCWISVNLQRTKS